MEPYRHSSQLKYGTEELTSNFKTDLFSGNWPNKAYKQKLLQFLCYCFLGICNKELNVFYGFFLSLEAKGDSSQPSVFRIFSHCQRNRNFNSAWQFNERGVFSPVFEWREDPALYISDSSIHQIFLPKLEKTVR